MTLMQRWRATLGAAFLSMCASAALAAVPDSRPYVSPEIHADRTVTFRILAPKASEVTLEGGWMAPKETVPLIKDDKGLWSVTVGPLRPTVYAYWFNLDGAVVLDQANESVRERTGGSSTSNVDVPDATTSLPWALRDVPHGVVDQRLIKSSTYGGETRNVWVYLPPGYETDPTKKYPVLYLFHGAGELHLSWVQSGKANLIFDNFIADGKMVPAIVVMPYTGPAANAVSRAAPPSGPPAGGAPGPGAALGAQSQQFALKEVVPWAEANFRILAGRKHHALAGLSAGGSLATGVALSDLADFSELGIFSSPIRSFNAYPVLSNAAEVNAKLDLFWISVGKSDPLATAGLRKGDADLTQMGIHHLYQETEGGHDFAVWRWSLAQFAPLLFRNGG